jgi:hypothetical protein
MTEIFNKFVQEDITPDGYYVLHCIKEKIVPDGRGVLHAIHCTALALLFNVHIGQFQLAE